MGNLCLLWNIWVLSCFVYFIFSIEKYLRCKAWLLLLTLSHSHRITLHFCLVILISKKKLRCFTLRVHRDWRMLFYPQPDSWLDYCNPLISGLHPNKVINWLIGSELCCSSANWNENVRPHYTSFKVLKPVSFNMDFFSPKHLHQLILWHASSSWTIMISQFLQKESFSCSKVQDENFWFEHFTAIMYAACSFVFLFLRVKCFIPST